MAADPLWINASAGAPAYTAGELRQSMALALQYDGRISGARQGVRPGGNALLVSLSVSTITAFRGVACVDPGLTTSQGPYWVSLAASETHTLTAADATNPRKDIVVLRVYDHDEDSSGLRLARTEYIVGTAAASPVRPATPAGAFRLATIDVPASGGGAAVVTDERPFVVAAGGILPVRNTTERNALSGYDGMRVWRIDSKTDEVYDGTAWRVLTPVLITASDVGFPINANALGSEVVSNRITVASVPYQRLLQIDAHTLASYSQASQRVAARLYVGATLLDTDQQQLVTNGIEESFKLSGQYVLPASTAGVVEVRFVRISGTGAVTTSIAASTYLRVSHRAA